MALHDRVCDYMGQDIVLVQDFGEMAVYRLPEWRSLNHPKFLVFRGCRLLETFHNKRAAFKWAAANQNG